MAEVDHGKSECRSYRNYGSSPRRLCLHVVILRATTNLAEPWSGWTGRDPSTPPGGIYPEYAEGLWMTR